MPEKFIIGSPGPLAFRLAAPGAWTIGTIAGRAIVYGALSSDRGGYRVRLLSGSAHPAPVVLGLYAHESRDLLASTKSRTLRLSFDAAGVGFEMDLPDTTIGRDVAAMVGRGDLAGMSFAMVDEPTGRVVVENGQTVREISRFTFDEISLTAIPAFKGAHVGPANSAPALAAAQHSARAYPSRVRASLQLQRLRLESVKIPTPKGH